LSPVYTKPAVGPTQSTIGQEMGVLFSGVKQPERESDHSSQEKISVAVILLAL